MSNQQKDYSTIAAAHGDPCNSCRITRISAAIQSGWGAAGFFAIESNSYIDKCFIYSDIDSI